MSLLTLNDRCDSCRAPAKAIICLSNGLNLFLCMHHTNQYETALKAKGATIVKDDEGVTNE